MVSVLLSCLCTRAQNSLLFTLFRPSCENQAIALDASNWSPTQSPKSLPSPHHAAHGTPKSRLRVSPLGTPKSRLRVSPLGTPKSRLWVSLLGTPKSRLRVSPHGTPKSRLPVSPHGTPKSRLRVSPLGTPNSRLRVSPLAGTPKSRLRVSPLGTPKSRLQVSPLGRRVHNAHDEGTCIINKYNATHTCTQCNVVTQHSAKTHIDNEKPR